MFKYTQKCVKMQRLVIIHVNPRRLCNEWKQKTENTRLTVNWICVALKVTAGYIPTPTVCLILIKQQKAKRKSLTAVHRRSFVALMTLTLTLTETKEM